MQQRNAEVLGCSENPQGMVDAENLGWQTAAGTGFCTRGTESSRNTRGGEAAGEANVVKILPQERQAKPRARVALTPSPGTAA